jgi:hypothetical protein
MKIWSVRINELSSDEFLDTYRGIAEDAKQAVQLAMERAREDIVAAIKEVAESESLTAEELAAEKQVELYASEVNMIGDVEFGG